MSPGERLKTWRKSRVPKLSQAALGELLDVSDVSVCLWESDGKLPSVEYREAIERLTDGEVPADSWGDEAEQERYRRLRAIEPLDPPADSWDGSGVPPSAEGAA